MKPTALVSMLLLTAACAGARGPNEGASASAPASAPAAAKPEIAYFVGTTRTTSPDGATPYGPPKKVVVRRTTDRRAGTIEEYVLQPGRELPTLLTRVAGTSTFEATDAARSFRGTLSFQGEEWAWNAWTYDIAMTDGSGTLRGEGKLTPARLETTKTFHGADGKPKARIVDELERVDERAFESARSSLLPGDAGADPGSAHGAR